MNILIVNLDRAGIMHYGIDLANNLANKGVKVVFLGYRFANEYLNSNVITINIYKRSFVEVYNKFLYTLKSLNPQVIHFTGIHPFFLLLSFYAKIRNIPVVLTLHDAISHPTQDKSFIKNLTSSRFFVKSLLKFTSEIIALSSYVAGEIKIAYKREPFIIPLSHDLSRYAIKSIETINRINRDNSVIKLLFFGKIDRYKGIEYLLEACRILKNKGINFSLKIAGRSANYKLIIPSEIEDNVDFENRFISESDIPFLFMSSDVVVLPYVEVSQSGVLPLAFAFGKPVIASNIGSFSEIVEEGINGFLVAPGSSDEIAEKIISLYLNRDLLVSLSNNAKETFNRKLKWESLIDRYIELYRRLIDFTNTQKKEDKHERVY